MPFTFQNYSIPVSFGIFNRFFECGGYQGGEFRCLKPPIAHVFLLYKPVYGFIKPGHPFKIIIYYTAWIMYFCQPMIICGMRPSDLVSKLQCIIFKNHLSIVQFG